MHYGLCQSGGIQTGKNDSFHGSPDYPELDFLDDGDGLMYESTLFVLTPDHYEAKAAFLGVFVKEIFIVFGYTQITQSPRGCMPSAVGGI